MDKSDQVNGEPKMEDSNKSPLKRKPRLNRRGFHLINNPIADLFSENIHKQNEDNNGGHDGSGNKSKVVGTEKRIISLSSVKKSTSEINPAKEKESRKIIILKRSSSTVDMKERKNTSASEVSGSCDPPPKKKHKPITWP